VQWRFLKAKGNSGVYIRSSDGVGQKTPPNEQTDQIQTFDDSKQAGTFFSEVCASRRSPTTPSSPRSRTAASGSSFEITCSGPNLAVKLNGELIAETHGSKLARGYLGFEGEYAPIEFRNIRVKDLGYTSARGTNWNSISPTARL